MSTHNKNNYTERNNEIILVVLFQTTKPWLQVTHYLVNPSF